MRPKGQSSQGPVSRHAKCYRAKGRRAKTPVTDIRVETGGTGVGPAARREYLARMRDRYMRATRREKSRLLDEAVTMTGYHRKALIRAWRVGAARRRRRGGRPVRYGPAVIRALVAIWTAAGYPWSVRLKALLPVWLPWARRRLALTPALETLLQAISARQIDRVLAARKRDDPATAVWSDPTGHAAQAAHPAANRSLGRDRAGLHGGRSGGPLGGPRGRRVPPLAQRHRHPHHLGRDAGGHGEKSGARPGGARAPARRHCRLRCAGSIRTMARSSSTTHLRRYCAGRQIQFTRGRPYKKDDNAHIEQKNWTHVCKLLGYVRYDSEAALAAINAVYADLRLLQNLFLPSVKLQRKERVGARVRRRYDVPTTPLDRVRACPDADAQAVAALVRLRDRLDPFVLAARIDRALARRLRARPSPPSPRPRRGRRGPRTKNARAPAALTFLNTSSSSVTPVLARRSAAR